MRGEADRRVPPAEKRVERGEGGTPPGRADSSPRRERPADPRAPPLVLLRCAGELAELSAADRTALMDRATSGDDAVWMRASAIIARVRREGDTALFEMAREFDGVELESLEVPRARWERAVDALEPGLARALERARANIETAHRAVTLHSTETETERGVFVGRRRDPLARVGVYAPGGRAAYPSSVLMGVVPARLAGVREILLCTPPDRTGRPAAVVLAAAALAGVDRVFALGGAGAVAAMAYGTASVPRVDRIVGPGNAYVAAAKMQVSGVVGIDSPAGPSEILVVADERASAELVAREMLGQAEHDPLACAVAVVVGWDMHDRVLAAVAAQLEAQPRRAIIAEALAARGAVLCAHTVDEALAFANEYAPEHLLLAVAEPRAAFERVRNAGTVFLGDASSVSFGDYMTGANHVLPTGALARIYSGLSVLDFVRWTTYQFVTPEAATRLARDVATLAEAEGLPGHAIAARAWDAR